MTMSTTGSRNDGVAVPSSPSHVAVEEALDRVADPCSIGTGAPLGLREMGLVHNLDIVDGAVRVTLRVTAPTCWQAINIVQAVERVVSEVPGVRTVECVVNFATEWSPSMMSAAAREKLRRARTTQSRSAQ